VLGARREVIRRGSRRVCKRVDLVTPGPTGRERRDRAEARLADKLRAGDDDALAVFEELYGRVLGGFLRDSLVDPGAVEEVRQQVLTEIWKRGRDYDPSRASVLTWALMIARSRAADERRRRRPVPVDVSVLEEAPADPELEPLLDRWRLAGLLEQIPAEEAETLRLRFYGGLSQSMIAERTGAPLGTVKTRMVRGLARLRGLIDEEEGR
jgi:RNA polymerase sigma-70 factor, ECF subfamily